MDFTKIVQTLGFPAGMVVILCFAIAAGYQYITKNTVPLVTYVNLLELLKNEMAEANATNKDNNRILQRLDERGK